MNDDTIQNQIAEITGTSPAATQVEAQKPIESEPTYSTLRVGTADTIQEAPAQQYENTTVGGVEFTPDTDEVMMAGTGIKGLGYDTRFKTPEDAGDPLYFEPNFLPVEPYPVGNVEANTINSHKLAYDIAKTMGAYDRDYIGYYRLPEPGSLSWWSFVNGAAGTFVESLPATLAKGITGAATSLAKAPLPDSPAIASAWRSVAENIMNKAPESDAGSFFNVVFNNYKENADALNNLQKIVNDAVEPLERRAFEMWDADVRDNSFKAQLGRGMMSGLGSFGLAALAKNPTLIFSLLNFAEVYDMRNKALNFGVSPQWAELYSIGTAGINTWLDTVQFDALVNSTSLVKQGTLDYLQNLGNKGLWQGIKKHAKRELAVAAAEAGVEMIQTTGEEIYNPEFRKDPTEALAIAAISAFALKAVTVPASVRHANLEEQLKLAPKFGLNDMVKQIQASGYVLADDLISKGAIQPSQRDAFVQSLISEAPDIIVKTLREGVKGELDKISPEVRKEMAGLLQDLTNVRGEAIFSPETMQRLDTQTRESVSQIGLPDSEIEMIQGLVRGAYVVSNIANRDDSSFKFEVPKFVVATNKGGYSYYDPKTNTIGIHGTRSDTVNTNASAQYVSQVTSGFRRATEMSDRMASTLHEMSHWLDHLVGQKGFGDFLEHYYNDIAKVFGEEKAQEMRDASDDGVNRISTEKKKGKSTEQHSQAVARLGKRSAESFGLGKSATNQFLSYANVMLNQLGNFKGKNGEALNKAIDGYQEALRAAIKENMDHLSDLIEVYGSEPIKEALSKFSEGNENYDDFAEYLADKDMLQELYDVMDNFSDAAGLQKISDLFNGDQTAMDNFVTMGDKMFRNGYNSAVEEVRQRRQDAKNKAEGKTKPVEAKADKDAVVTGEGVVISKTNDKIDASDMPTFFDDKGVETERVGYASMRGTLEGQELDVDKHYAEGEAFGTLGAGMRHGYGNNVLFDYLQDKKYYYDRWVAPTLGHNQTDDNIDTHRVFLALDQLNDAFPKQIKDINTKQELKDKFQKQADSALKSGGVALEEGKQALKQRIDYIKEASGKSFTDGQLDDMYTTFAQTRAVDALDEGIMSSLDISQEFYDENLKSTVHKFNEEIVDHVVFADMYKDAISSLNHLSDDFVVEKKKGGAEMHSFEVPDSEYLLDEELPLDEQSPYVKNSIITMAKENPNISLFYGEYTLGEIGSMLDESDLSDFAAYIDDEYTNVITGENFRRALNDYFRYDEEGKKERVKFFENMIKDKKQLDGAIKTDAYRTTSLLLDKYGIQGIEFNGKRDGHGAVIFNGHTKHLERLHEEGSTGQMQDWAKAALGAKESVKQSFESAKETKQIPADKQIDGRNLTDDINMASNGLSQRVAQPMNKFVKWASSSKWGWGLDRILVTILGRDAAEKFDVAGKYSAKQAARTRYWDEFQKRLESLFGEKDKTKFMFKYKTMVTDLGFVRMNNVEMINPANTALSFKRNITGWEAMYVYLMDRQGYGARVQKSTTTNIKDIIALLSPEEKSFADAMSDQLMDMYKRTFKEGSKYENYFPIQSAEHELYNELSIDSLTARQKTDDAIAIIDAGRVFSQYVSRWASHESGYFETLKRLRDVFGYRGVSANEAGPGYIFNADEEESRIKASAQVAATVRQVLGNDGYDNLMNNINSEIQDKQELLFDKSRQNVLTQLGNNIMKSILANKVISFPKNAVNMMMMFGGAKDQSLYWNSFAEGWAKPKETYNYMMDHSHEIKQRWGSAGGYNEYLDQRTLGGNTAPAMKAVSKAFANMKWDGDRTNNMAKFSAVMDMLGDAGLKLFMQSGDMIANVYGGYGLIKDYIAQGMTEEEAFKKLDRYIIEHQSSSNLAMKPLIQKEHMGDFLGQVFAFTSEGVAKWASIMGTFDEVNMGTATRSEAITNAASIAISMALYSILAAGAWDLLSDDEKVQEDTQKALVNTVIDQVFGGMVAGNALISPMISYMIGDTRLSGMSTPFYNYAIDAGTALKKGNYFEAWLKAQSALGLPIGADNAWNSMLGISLLTDPNPQVREAGKLMMMGYTKNRAAKRAGIDKETIENSGEE